MSRTDHQKGRHRITNPKRERTERTILRRAIALQDYDTLPTTVSTRHLRTYSDV